MDHALNILHDKIEVSGCAEKYSLIVLFYRHFFSLWFLAKSHLNWTQNAKNIFDLIPGILRLEIFYKIPSSLLNFHWKPFVEFCTFSYSLRLHLGIGRSNLRIEKFVALFSITFNLIKCSTPSILAINFCCAVLSRLLTNLIWVEYLDHIMVYVRVSPSIDIFSNYLNVATWFSWSIALGILNVKLYVMGMFLVVKWRL